MNPHDQDRLDTVLQGLGRAEPAAGMEQRIAAALLRAEQSRQVKPDRWRLPFSGTVALPRLAFAAAIVTAAALFLLHARHGEKTFTAGTHVAHSPAGKSAILVQPIVPVGLHKESIPDPVPAHVRSHTQVEPASRQTATEERSFPAPPLPLTEQERLLIRLIHREAPVQLAQLTTPAIDAARQREADEVTAFFAPPRIAEPEQPPTPDSTDPTSVPTNAAPKEIQ